MTDHLRAQQLSRLAGILAEADTAHEHSSALAARALELDRTLELERVRLGFTFEEIAAAHVSL
jgi:hypothetical protein